MGIFCDYPGCDAKTHQPLPAGWDIEWNRDEKRYDHRCAHHSVRGQKMLEALGQAPRRATPRRSAPEAESDDQGSLF